MRTVKQQLKHIQHTQGLINPDPSWVSENKNRLMSQIRNTQVVVDEKVVTHNTQYAWYELGRLVQTFTPRNFSRALRPLATAVLALVLTTGGWVASAYAEPGDTLWGAKEAWNSVLEKGQLAFTPSGDEAPLHLEFASKRAQVLKQVVEKQDVELSKKEELVKKTAGEIKEKLESANESLRQTDPDKAALLVKDVSLKTKEISDTLKETAEKMGEANKELGEDIGQQAVDAKKKSLEMVEVVVQKKAEAQVQISEEEKNIIKDHLDEVVKDIKQDAEKAKTTADSLMESVEAGFLDTVSSTTDVAGNAVVSSTPSVVTSTDAVGITSTTATGTIQTTTQQQTTMKAEDKVLGVSQQIDKAVESLTSEGGNVDVLVEENILEAIKKTQELSSSVGQTVQQVQNTAAEFLPQIINSGIRTVAPVITPNTSSTLIK